MDLTRLAGRKSSGSLPASVSIKLELQVHTPTHNLAFYLDAWRPDCGPQACATSALPPQPSPWPLDLAFLQFCLEAV